MGTVTLIEIDVVSPAGAASVLRFSDAAVRPFPPADPDRANLVWDDRLTTAPTMRRALFEDVSTLTPGLSAAVITLANGDGGLDAYQGHVWGEARIWRWIEGTAFAAARLRMKGPCGLPSFGHTTKSVRRVDIALYDYRADLDQPASSATYAGTNGTGGVLYEGSADGLKGQAKPLAYGDLTDAHLPAPQVNAGVLAYQLHNGALAGPVAIFDRGAPAGLVMEADRSGVSFDTFNPSAARAVTDLGRGLVKMNTNPVGAVTFGTKGENTGVYVETTGPILARLLARAGVPAGRIGASFAALAAAAPIGVYAQDDGQARELINWVAKSALAGVLPGRDGVWQVVKLAAPKAVADLALGYYDVLACEADDSAPPPVGVVKVGWGRIWSQFRDADLAPTLRNTAAGTRLLSAYRYATVENATVKARMPSAWRTVTIDTALRTEADAMALATLAMTLFGLRPDGRPRRQWTVQLAETDAALARDLGDTIRLTYPPLGLDGDFLLIAEQPSRPRRDLTTWTLWG